MNGGGGYSANSKLIPPHIETDFIASGYDIVVSGMKCPSIKCHYLLFDKLPRVHVVMASIIAKPVSNFLGSHSKEDFPSPSSSIIELFFFSRPPIISRLSGPARTYRERERLPDSGLADPRDLRRKALTDPSVFPLPSRNCSLCKDSPSVSPIPPSPSLIALCHLARCSRGESRHPERTFGELWAPSCLN